MAVSDTVFAGSIPQFYDRFMVPMIFAPYARDIADRLAAMRPENVLETAAGTGVVTREIALRLGAGARITATDLNPAMLDWARAHLADGRIAWQQADALALPFADATFDAVLCQFGVMFFPDRVQGYREARRVLRRGGVLLFNVWDQLSTNDFITVVSAELARIFPDDPPNFMARTPHGYFDLARIESDVRAAGFTEFTAETLTRNARAASAGDAAKAYCMGTPLRAEIEARGPGRLDAVTDAVARALAREFGAGPIEGAIQAIVVTASGQASLCVHEE